MADRIAEAQTLRDAFTQFADRVRSNGDLTDDAKRRQIDDQRSTTNERLRSLRDAALGEFADQTAEIERRLLGRPMFGRPLSETEQVTLSISYRDALDRARAAEGPALVAVIDDAGRVGDDVQLRAALTEVLRRADVTAANAYVQHRPDDEPALQEWFDARAQSQNRLRDQLDIAMKLGDV